MSVAGDLGSVTYFEVTGQAYQVTPRPLEVMLNIVNFVFLLTAFENVSIPTIFSKILDYDLII